jgi:hypothetical protein
MLSAILALAPHLIGPLIKSAEAIFGPKTGETKLQVVVGALTPVLEKMAAAGKLPGIPSSPEINAAIEATLAGLKSTEIPGNVPSGHVAIYLPPGDQLVTIESAEPKE